MKPKSTPEPVKIIESIPINQPVGLLKLCDITGMNISQAFIPEIEVTIQDAFFDEETSVLSLKAYFDCPYGQANFVLNFNLKSRAFIELSCRAASSANLTVADVFPGMLAAQALEQWSKFNNNIGLCTLKFLKLSINQNKGFSIYSEGSFAGVSGNIGLSFTIKDSVTLPLLSFRFLTDEQVLLQSVQEIIAGMLGLDISGAVLSMLPKIQVGISELVFNQAESLFKLRGVIALPGNDIHNEAYLTEGSLEIGWLRGFQLNMELDAGKTPVTLGLLERSLPFSLDDLKNLLPEKTAEKIRLTTFNSFSTKLNTDYKSVSISGVINLFGQLLATGTFSYNPANGLAFNVNVYGDPLSFKELSELLGLEIDQAGLPAIKIGLRELNFDQSQRKFSIKGALAGGKGSAAIGLGIRILPEGVNISFDYFSEGTEHLTAGDLISSSLPDSFKKMLPANGSYENVFLKNLKSSSLAELQMNINTVEKELDFYARGQVLQMTGEIGFSIINIDGQPKVFFQLYGDEQVNLKSVQDVLQKTLGLDISDEIVAYLPKMEFALAELSFDQSEALFRLRGVVAQSGYKQSQKGYKLNGGLQVGWLNGIQIGMELDAGKAPINIVDFIEELPIQLDKIQAVVPEPLLTGIKFYHLNIAFDGPAEKISVSSAAEIFGTRVQSDFVIFRKQRSTFFTMDAAIDRIGIKDIIAGGGIITLPAGFPDLTFSDLKFGIDTEAASVSLKGDAAATIAWKIGNIAVALRLGIDVVFSTSKPITGIFSGELDLANITFLAVYQIGEEHILKFNAKPNDTGHEIGVNAFINNIMPGTALPEGLPDLKINDFKGSLNLSVAEFNFNGVAEMYGAVMTAQLAFGKEKKLALEQIQNSDSHLSLKQLFAEISKNTIGIPGGIPDCTITHLKADLDFVTGALDFSGESVFNWVFPGTTQSVAVNSKAVAKRLPGEQEGEYIYDLKLKITGLAPLTIIPGFTIAGFNLSFDYTSGSWEFEGDLKILILDEPVDAKASIVRNANKTLLAPKTTGFTNLNISNLLHLAGQNVPDFPDELNVLDFETGEFELSLDTEQNFALAGSVAIKSSANKANAKISLGDEALPIARFLFDITKTSDESKIVLTLDGNNIPRINTIDAQIKSYELKFETSVKQNEMPDWYLGGYICLEAFDRLMILRASAMNTKKIQNLSFEFDSSQLALHEEYLKDIEGLYPEQVLKVLNNGAVPQNKQLPLAQLPDDVLAKLGNDFTVDQKRSILDVVTKAGHANEPLISIPDLLNDDKPLCTVSPRLFSLKLTRENKQFKSIDFAIGADLTIYNTLLDQQEIFSLKNGLVSSGYDRQLKRFYLTFYAEQATVKPFNAISVLPGILDALITAFGETADYHPKTSAFVDMLEVQPKGFTFIKQDKAWKLAGSIRMVLNDGLRTVNSDLYNFIEKLFPKTGDVRYIEGSLSYDSKDGLYFVLENNNGLEIPNFLKMATDAIDPQFKADFKQKTGVDLDQALDLGTSFVILDRLRVKIAKQAEMDMRIGIGLPSKLNDRLFNPSSKIHGLINTYNREKFEKAAESQSTQRAEYNTPLPDDNLIRATLKIGTEGISGQLEQFNMFNWHKIAEEFSGLITEQSEHVIVDLNALTNNGGGQYGKLKIEKFKFKLDLKTCAFNIGGGIELLSDALRIPVRPLLKKLIAILPTDKFNTNVLNALADKLTNHIALQSINFYDPASGSLQLDDLLNFFRQFLLEDYKQLEIFPQALLDLLRQHSHEITKLLPEMLLEYLSIKIPAGLKFQAEITSDQSVSFAVEIPEPTPGQKAAGYTDHLQVLIPDFSMPPMGISGLRLKKIGLGSGLFNQAIRLDLSGELTGFRYMDLIAGVAMGLVRNAAPDDARLQHMVPNVKSFGMSYRIENLLMLIFPQTYIPIPVPVFYDNFFIYSAGLEGSETELSIRFPRPKVNIKEAFGILGELVKFFKDKDFALPIASYGEVRKTEEIHQDSIIPTFYAGPVYVELPGILGYQKFPDGSRKHIVLGFKDLKVFNPRDLAALAANTAKFAILSIAEKQRHRIKIDYNRSEYPINYFVKFLPETRRIGTSEIVLFDIFDVNFAWALSTPGEFKEKVFPLLLQEQLKSGRPGYNDNWTANELLNMIPNADKWNNEQDGVVVFLKGSINISDQFTIDAVTASAITSSDGVSTGISMRSRLANIFDMELSGGIRIDAMSAENKFGLAGKTSLIILGRIPVLKGSFSMGVGSQSHLKFNGLLDLFPDELFGGNRSPVQLYTGTQRGTKSDITGVVDRHGINIGHYNADGTISAAGLHLEIGSFYLGGTTRIVTTADRQEWEMKLTWYNTELSLGAGFYSIENGNEMQFAWSANSPIGIENLLSISGSEPGSGASGKLVLTYRGQSLVPEFTECYLDGAISLFGLTSSTRLHIKQDGFFIDTNTNLGILNTKLKISGANFNDVSGFALSGDVGLLNDVCKFHIDASYYRTHDKALFKGSGYLDFWGERRMNLQLEAGNDGGRPFFNAEGVLDLSLANGLVKLYTGTRDGMSAIRGSIDQDRLELTGALFFQVGELKAGGSFDMTLDGGGEFRTAGNLSFQVGVLAGGSIEAKIAKSGHLLYMNGSASGNITLIPGIFELSSASSFSFWMNQVTNELGQFQLSGNTTVLGINAWYNLNISPNSFAFDSNVYLQQIDLSLNIRSENLSSVDSLRISGKIDITKLNAEIDRFYEAIGIRGKVNDKANAALNGMHRLQGTQQDMRYRQERIDFIRGMDSVWNRNGIDPHGFQYCVPPAHHVDYWSDSRWNWDWGRPRYSKEDLDKVRRYYQYKRELGMNADEPPRHDIARFVNGVLQAINNTAYEVATGASNIFRQVVNDIHNLVSNQILRNLNIDTTDINSLNNSFNEGINVLNNEAAKWRDFNQRLLNYKPLEIKDITYTDQSIDLLRLRPFTARVTFTVLGEERTVEQVFDINDPAGCLIRNARQFLPAELNALGG